MRSENREIAEESEEEENRRQWNVKSSVEAENKRKKRNAAIRRKYGLIYGIEGASKKNLYGNRKLKRMAKKLLASSAKAKESYGISMVSAKLSGGRKKTEAAEKQMQPRWKLAAQTSLKEKTRRNGEYLMQLSEIMAKWKPTIVSLGCGMAAKSK